MGRCAQWFLGVLPTADLGSNLPGPFGPVPAGHTHMVVFCRTAPSSAPAATELDRFEIVGREVHRLIAGKLTDSKITLPKLARVIGPNTTRNITSLERLAALVR